MIRLISKSRFFSFLMIVTSVGLISSCTCDEDCAEFSNFQLCGTAPVAAGCSDNLTVIPQDASHITVSVEIKHGEPDDMLSVKFFIEDGGSFTEFSNYAEPLRNIDDSVDGSERKIRGSVGIPKRADRLWPVGNYKVEIELSQENVPLNETRNFTVE